MDVCMSVSKPLQHNRLISRKTTSGICIFLLKINTRLSIKTILYHVINSCYISHINICTRLIDWVVFQSMRKMMAQCTDERRDSGHAGSSYIPHYKICKGISFSLLPYENPFANHILGYNITIPTI